MLWGSEEDMTHWIWLILLLHFAQREYKGHAHRSKTLLFFIIEDSTFRTLIYSFVFFKRFLYDTTNNTRMHLEMLIWPTMKLFKTIATEEFARS